jgi:DNA-binding transcriptional ArsR family regulator
MEGGALREADEKSIEKAFGTHYAKAQYIWTQIFTEHLADCSRIFHGDLQAVLIMAVVGQSYLSRYLNQVGSRLDGTQPSPTLPGTAISASSLSDVLGIPRETVRRKLEDLRRAGWIEKDAQAGWQIAIAEGRAVARKDLAELDRRGVARVARLAAELQALAKADADKATP